MKLKKILKHTETWKKNKEAIACDISFMSMFSIFFSTGVTGLLNFNGVWIKRDKNYVVLICSNVETDLDEKVQMNMYPKGTFLVQGQEKYERFKSRSIFKVANDHTEVTFILS